MVFILGALVGFVASFTSALLGGGSALITIPAFYYILVHYYTPTSLMQITIVTVSCISILIGLVSTYKHYKIGNIDM